MSHRESSDRPSDSLNQKQNGVNVDVLQLYANSACHNSGHGALPESIDFASAASPYGSTPEEQSKLFKQVSEGHLDWKGFSSAENKLLTGSSSNDVTEHVTSYKDGYWKPVYARLDTQQKSIWTAVKNHDLSEADFQKIEATEQRIETLKANLEKDGSLSPTDRTTLNRAIDAQWEDFKTAYARDRKHPSGQPSGGGTDTNIPPSGGDTNTPPNGGDTNIPPSGGDTNIPPGGDTNTGTNTNPDGQFTIKDGQIIGPDGKPFIAKGIAVNAGSAVQDEATILKYFPKVNTIRLATGADGNTYTGKGKTPEEVAQETQQFIDDMTKRGIVVIVDDHQPGDRHVPATGSALKAEEDWYAKLAQANKNNPYVWFQTPNEPVPGNASTFVKDTVAEEKAIYNAVRSTGNDNIVVAEMASNYTADRITGDPSVFSEYSSMKNVVFDYHIYNRTPEFIKHRLASTAPITDTQGVIPAIIGEYGNTDSGGTLVTAAGDRNLKAVQESGLGSVAWALHNGSAKTDENKLLDKNGQLTPYGQEVADYINS
ncbi:MAG: cellulase family glycosylhydrolase [Cyanobacteria bacterium SZAS-4]|nr:cellulase family glycosylhydrolase [Cyanobacteria bacterium SZAS-4]